MRKKPITILAAAMAWLLLASTALAVVTIEADAVYANGHTITVVRDDATGDTRVTSDEAEAGLAGNTTNIAGRDIYGGKKDGDLNGNTNVTIQGGTVGDVYGGGKNGDVNGSTNVVVNGGTTGDVYGGGNAVGGNGGWSSGADVTANVTKGTNVTVNGGTVNGDIHGGGHADGGEASPIAGGGDADATVATGANVTINGGTVKGDVYGGGHADAGDGFGIVGGGNADTTVSGGTGVTVSGGNVNGNVYGGGEAEAFGGVLRNDGLSNANVKGGTTVTVDKSSVKGSVTTNGNDKGGRATAEVEGPKVLKYSKQVTVTTNYSITGVPLVPNVRTYTVYSGDPAQAVTPVMPTFTGSEHYTFTASPTSGSISYTGGNVVFNVTGQKRSTQVTVTTNYSITGVPLDPDVKTYTVYSGDPAQEVTPVMPTFAGSEHYTFTASPASGSISYTSGNVVFNVTGVPNSRTILVRFNYLHNGTVIVSDEQSVTLTYGEGGKPVTSTISVPAGYYLLGDVPTVTVNYAMALEMGEKAYEVDVPLGIITGGTGGTPQIPLGPGTPQTIPLGLGIPSTGDTAGMRVLLMACGAALIAFVAIRARRSSSK